MITHNERKADRHVFIDQHQDPLPEFWSDLCYYALQIAQKI